MSSKIKILLVLTGVLILTTIGFVVWQQKTQASEEDITAQNVGRDLGDISRTVGDISRTVGEFGNVLTGKQTDGTLRGKVTEEGTKGGKKDKVISGAKVSAVAIDKWGINPGIQKLTGVTDDKGEYKIRPAKSQTVYLLTFEADGYLATYAVSGGKKFISRPIAPDDSEKIDASMKRGTEGSLGGTVTYKGLPLNVEWPGGLGAIEFSFTKKPAESPQVLYSPVFSNRATDASYSTFYFRSWPVGDYEGTASITNYLDTKSEMQADGTTGQPIPVSFKVTKSTRTTVNLDFLKKGSASTPPATPAR